MIPANFPLKARGILDSISPGRRYWSSTDDSRPPVVPSPFTGVPPMSLRMTPDEAARTIGMRSEGTISQFLKSRQSPQNIRTNEPPHPSTAPYPPDVAHDIETQQGTGRTSDIQADKAADLLRAALKKEAIDPENVALLAAGGMAGGALTLTAIQSLIRKLKGLPAKPSGRPWWLVAIPP